MADSIGTKTTKVLMAMSSKEVMSLEMIALRAALKQRDVSLVLKKDKDGRIEPVFENGSVIGWRRR